jgi:hypothetical protein
MKPTANTPAGKIGSSRSNGSNDKGISSSNSSSSSTEFETLPSIGQATSDPFACEQCSSLKLPVQTLEHMICRS